ncbi:MAG: ribosome hibernation-promoting factor, HPF/YfiA family [Christensenellales bacterium]
MKLDLTGLRIEVTDAIIEFVYKKIQKLNKFFDEDTLCHVTYTASTKGKQHVDMRIEYKSHTYIAEDDVDDLYYGVESLISKIERQCRKVKDENIGKKRSETVEVETEDVEE